MFALNTDGSVFTTLHSFTVGPYGSTNSEGWYPRGLILSDNVLYGTTSGGGDSGNGTVFSISLLRPQLQITSDGANVILKWPVEAIGLSLQCSTNEADVAAWTTVSTAPVVVNGQNTVTNPISGTKQFYRLSQ